MEADVGGSGNGTVGDGLGDDEEVAGFGRVCAEGSGWGVVVTVEGLINKGFERGESGVGAEDSGMKRHLLL